MQRQVSGRIPVQPGASGERDFRALVTHPTTVKFLLLAGAAAGLLYVANDIHTALRYAGYSYKDQAPSELSAVGAPTRLQWTIVGTVYALLVTGFGVGVWVTAGGGRALRMAGALVVTLGLIGLLAWPFAPMHKREVLAAGGGTWSDTLHLVLVAVDAVLFLLTMGLAAKVCGKRFRLYSLVTMVVLLVFGFLTSTDAHHVQDNEPTPWMGIIERVSVYTTMLWYAVFALVLLRLRRGQRGAGRPSGVTDWS